MVLGVVKTIVGSILCRGVDIMGAFQLSELTGQTHLEVMRISLLIKTIQPDLSNPTWRAGKRWFFGKNPWKTSIALSK